MSFPVECLPLGKTDGEWILIQQSDGRIKIKLYGDSTGRDTTYWIVGDLGYLSIKRRIEGEDRDYAQPR